MEKVTELIFLDSKVTVDSDCGYKIKRHLLLERKAMTSLDSILKSRDTTLSTKICLVKAMVFPVGMYGCESWTIKKVQILVLEETLKSSLDSKEIKPVNPKGNQP